MTCKQFFRSSLVIGGMLALTCLTAQGQTQKVAYYVGGVLYGGGHIVEWNDTTGRATKIDSQGVTLGSFTRDASDTRILTYDHPRSVVLNTVDRCGLPAQIRRDTSQAIYRALDRHPGIGKTQLTPVITRTWLDGCDAGKTEPEPYRSDGRPPMLRHPLRIKTPIDDLTAGGARVAGLAELPIAMSDDGADFHSTPVDTAFFSAVPGSITFEQSGNQYPVSLSTQGWLILNLPSGHRAYRRMAVDPKTGAEIWLVGDMQGDQLKWVEQTTVIKPQVGASFGTTQDIAHRWLSSLRSPDYLFGFTLYGDGAGDTCGKTPPEPLVCFFPLTWNLDGTSLQFHQMYPEVWERIRVWEPLARADDKQWMYESLTYYYVDGRVWTLITRRINYYVDKGPSQARRQ